MQSNWSHDDACMACGDGGELLLCDMCPAAYHLECIGAGQVGHPAQSHLLIITNDGIIFLFRCLLVVGRAPIIFVVSVKRRAKTAATVSSGAHPHLRTIFQPLVGCIAFMRSTAGVI
jgi:hypothetical protein